MSNNDAKRIVGVHTHNDYLFQKIKLNLPKDAMAIRLDLNSEEFCDIVLVDGEDDSFSNVSGLIMKKDEGDIPLPFKIDALLTLTDTDSNAALTLSDSQKSATLGNRTVKLTDLEYRLLSLLVSANGSFVEREKILKEVWEEKADKGIINVYIHYLREKLEANGEKIILSSRNYGYKVNEKFLGGKN